MDDVRIVYNEERGTYNVIVNGEWYAEGNYEYCNDVANSFLCPEEDEYYGDDCYWDDWEPQMEM